MGNDLFKKTWTVGGGHSEHEDDLPTVGATMKFIKPTGPGHHHKITVQCSSNINRPGSDADWNTLKLDKTGHHGDFYVGTVMIGSYAKVATVRYIEGGGAGGKDAITCDFNDLIVPSGMPAPNTHLGVWHGDG